MRHHDPPQPIVGISVIEHAPLALFHPEFLKVSATASVSMQRAIDAGSSRYLAT
jgi:hypothetical protein